MVFVIEDPVGVLAGIHPQFLLNQWMDLNQICMDISLRMQLTLKAPTTIAADDSHKYFFIVFQRK